MRTLSVTISISLNRHVSMGDISVANSTHVVRRPVFPETSGPIVTVGLALSLEVHLLFPVKHHPKDLEPLGRHISCIRYSCYTFTCSSTSKTANQNRIIGHKPVQFHAYDVLETEMYIYWIIPS